MIEVVPLLADVGPECIPSIEKPKEYSPRVKFGGMLEKGKILSIELPEELPTDCPVGIIAVGPTVID